MGKGVPFGSHAENQSWRAKSEDIRVTSGVPQGSVLDPLLVLACVNDIWRNTVSTIRLFADDCVIYKK